METKLNIILITLVNGEEVIANLQDYYEEVNGEKVKVCYNMIYPFAIINQKPDSNDDRVPVALKPWKFFSIDTSFLISFDKVMNICAPIPSMEEMYKKAVENYIKSLRDALALGGSGEVLK